MVQCATDCIYHLNMQKAVLKSRVKFTTVRTFKCIAHELVPPHPSHS